jgi:hypothetical protein
VGQPHQPQPGPEWVWLTADDRQRARVARRFRAVVEETVFDAYAPAAHSRLQHATQRERAPNLFVDLGQLLARERSPPFRGWNVGWKVFGEEKVEMARAAYGQNFDRLSELKGRYDPDNLFRMNINVPPAVPVP